jgi:hypothetical protein
MGGTQIGEFVSVEVFHGSPEGVVGLGEVESEGMQFPEVGQVGEAEVEGVPALDFGAVAEDLEVVFYLAKTNVSDLNARDVAVHVGND